EPQLSLFSSDAAVLTDADIERILSYEYHAPESAKIAVLSLGRELWRGYSDELSRTAESVRNEFTNQLETARSVVNAEYLPSLLIPTNHSVTPFREAASRFQVDLLVVYQTSCQTYQKFRFFAANTSKSFCNVEAVVLDVRTGIVPYTVSATHEFRIEQSDNDANIYETRRNAELSAVQAALTGIGEDLVEYLSSQ
ncbi:MAG TPA: hypothetical protein VF275_03530, partial [Gammaproteobacteria bacterium]